MVDKAGPKALTKPLGEIITQPLNKRKKMEKMKKKWVDDFTILASLDLKQCLVEDPDPLRPVP
jgi:hypothetical protein